jgi:hypothetical protein
MASPAIGEEEEEAKQLLTWGRSRTPCEFITSANQPVGLTLISVQCMANIVLDTAGYKKQNQIYTLIYLLI